MIDWDSLWQIHSPYYEDGLVRLPLPNGKIALLKAGPSFGDLSHPTTNLILSYLTEPLVKGKVVVDIGTGSGILAIVAALLGAAAVYAFEIDPPSILHVQENIHLNNLSSSILVNVNPKSSPDVVLMNMISSEQEIALKEHPYLLETPHTLITSGVLLEESEKYLLSRPERVLFEKKDLGIWSSFFFLIQ